MPPTSPTIKIVSPSDLVVEQYARWGWYGEQGVGKSTLAATVANAPGIDRALIINIEGESLDAYKPHADKIKVVRIYRWDQLAEVLILLRSKANPFQAVIFDSWPSRLAIMKIAGIDLSSEEAADLIRNPHKLSISAKKGQDNYQLWQDVASLQYTTYVSFADLPAHLALIFQPEEREKNGEVHCGPALSPQTAQLIRPQLKLCGYLYAEPDELVTDIKEVSPDTIRPRRLLVDKHPYFFAKGPSHVLGATVLNPTWSKLSKSLGAAPMEIEEEE